MCKGNTISTSWSRIADLVLVLFVIGGFIATWLGARPTWGEVMIIPFILGYILSTNWNFSFLDSGFTLKRRFLKQSISAEQIKQIDVFGTKSGTWIVIEINGAPDISPIVSRKAIMTYYLKNYRKSFLIPLQFGERDKALEILRSCYPQKVVIVS